jgi:hypothetical protein
MVTDVDVGDLPEGAVDPFPSRFIMEQHDARTGLQREGRIGGKLGRGKHPLEAPVVGFPPGASAGFVRRDARAKSEEGMNRLHLDKRSEDA